MLDLSTEHVAIISRCSNHFTPWTEFFQAKAGIFQAVSRDLGATKKNADAKRFTPTHSHKPGCNGAAEQFADAGHGDNNEEPQPSFSFV
uniref:Uncharacterized protein n=1 Tax=Romanomermis culicivorax TaxID=13658 RepID=A0A915ITE7_ROMCU